MPRGEKRAIDDVVESDNDSGALESKKSSVNPEDVEPTSLLADLPPPINEEANNCREKLQKAHGAIQESSVRGATADEVRDELVKLCGTVRDDLMAVCDAVTTKLEKILAEASAAPAAQTQTQGPSRIATATWCPSHWTTTQIQALEYNPDNPYFTLNSSYLNDSGLGPSGPLMLYRRKTFEDQFIFLQDRVLKEGCLGWILGPPGTGKSTTALAFASTLNSNEWVVTWLHLSSLLDATCNRYEGGTKKTCDEISDKAFLDNVLNEVEKGRNHIVFLDGYVSNNKEHADMLKSCYNWLRKDRSHRRLVVVCSMSARGKTSADQEDKYKVEQLFVYSWTLDEYLEAIQDKAFFDSIKLKLDVTHSARDDDVEQRANLIKSKFYCAGGCSRFMFYYDTAKVIDKLKESVGEVGDILPYINGYVGDQSNAVINRLISTYHNPVSNDQKARHNSIVSAGAASRLAMKGGIELVTSLAKLVEVQHIGAMNGWMFEMWFFACLGRNKGVDLYHADGKEAENWPPSSICDHDCNQVPNISDTHGVWLKPFNCNQGGYDAIFMDMTKEKKLVRFVQITRASQHDFKVHFFSAFLELLTKSKVTVDEVEIVFLVDFEKIKDFRIHQVFGGGTLATFPGWKGGKDKREPIVRGMKDWNQPI